MVAEVFDVHRASRTGRAQCMHAVHHDTNTTELHVGCTPYIRWLYASGARPGTGGNLPNPTSTTIVRAAPDSATLMCYTDMCAIFVSALPYTCISQLLVLLCLL